MSFSIELGKAAHKLVKDICDVRPGENVLVYDDSSCDPRVREAIAAAAHTVGATATMCTFQQTPGSPCNPPPPVAAAMKAADVLIDQVSNYTLYSQAQQAALDNIRVYFLTGGWSVEDIVRLVGRCNYAAMIEFGELLRSMTQKANKVRMANKAGTDVVGMNDGREVMQFGGVYKMPTGIYKEIMPAGQVGWCPIEETINGTIVYDGFLFPPEEIGALPNPPVKITVKNGIIVDVEPNKNGIIFKKWLESFNDPNMYRIAHFTYGISPTAELKPTTKICEGERKFGNIEFGMGMQGALLKGKYWKAASHSDGTCIAASVWLDDKQIEDNGKFVDEELAKLAKKMGMEGY